MIRTILIILLTPLYLFAVFELTCRHHPLPVFVHVVHKFYKHIPVPLLAISMPSSAASPLLLAPPSHFSHDLLLFMFMFRCVLLFVGSTRLSFFPLFILSLLLPATCFSVIPSRLLLLLLLLLLILLILLLLLLPLLSLPSSQPPTVFPARYYSCGCRA